MLVRCRCAELSSEKKLFVSRSVGRMVEGMSAYGRLKLRSDEVNGGPNSGGARRGTLPSRGIGVSSLELLTGSTMLVLLRCDLTVRAEALRMTSAPRLTGSGIAAMMLDHRVGIVGDCARGEVLFEGMIESPLSSA